MPKWTLMGSTVSLDDVAPFLKQRLYWSTAELIPTDDPKVWDLRNGKGVLDKWRVREHRGRYRIEAL